MRYVYEGVALYPGIAVTLSKTEEAWGTEIGIRRHEEATRKNLPDRHGFKGDSKQIHIQGACGEYAVALAKGIPWSASVNTFKRGGDVGPFQVRTRDCHDWDLIIREDDRPDDTFYLVTGRPPRFRIVGYVVARVGMVKRNEQTYADRPKAWFVPHGMLHPFRLDDWRYGERISYAY